MKKSFLEIHRNCFTTLAGYLIIGNEMFFYLFHGMTPNVVNITIAFGFFWAKDTDNVNPFKK